MRIIIAAVGRAKAGPARDLYELYAKRLDERAFARLVLKEVEEKRRLPPAALVEREGELLLAAVPQDAPLIALDEAGKTLSSRAFADYLAAARDDGVAELAFAIGGADGLAPAVKERARMLLSLGPMTWPHLLVRALLAEQLYRVQTLLTQHPYHRP